jgi:iron-sulfur cluster repair protein YtfE (RIC family)
MRHPVLVPLSHDHHHGLALALRCRKQALGQIKPMGVAGLHQRAKECLEFYANNLAGHFRAEEEALFPALRGAAPGCAAILDDLLNQHKEIRRLMSQLETGAGLAKLIFDLGDLLERHIRKEERELFPIFEEQVSEASAAAVGAQVKKILETQPG